MVYIQREFLQLKIYVYVSENSLIELDADDIPEIPLGDISVNDCSIGDSNRKS